MDSASETAAIETPDSQPMSRADIRHNMTFCILNIGFWSMGFANLSLVIQPLLVYLGASNTKIGFILGATAFTIPGVLLSPFITRHFRVKRKYLFAANVPYVFVIGMMGVVLALSHRFHLSPAWLLGFVTVMMITQYIFCGFTDVPSREFTSACIPQSHRGRYVGLTGSASSLFGIMTALAGGWVLRNCAKPMSFGYLLIAAWVLCQGGYFFVLFTREKPTPVEKSPKPWSKGMFKAAWDNKPFVRYLSMISVFDLLIFQSFGFVNIYGYKRLGMSAATASIIMLIGQIMRVSTSAPIGALMDKIGAKRLFPYWMGLGGLALLPPILVHSPYAIYVSVALSGLAMSGVFATDQVIIYSLPKPEDRAGHFMMKLLQQSVCYSIGAIWIGHLCDMASYRLVFIIVSAMLFGMIFFSRSMLANMHKA